MILPRPLRASAAPLPASEIVTGERLQALAEVTVATEGPLTFHRHVERFAPEIVRMGDRGELTGEAIARLSRARSIFVYSHELDLFLDHVWPRLEGEGYVLVTHNSDHGVDAARLPFLDASGAKLSRWLAQNVDVEHPKLVPLPIGVANSMWPHGNLRRFHRAMDRAHAGPKTGVIYPQFNVATYPGRPGAWAALRTHFPGLPETPPPPTGFRQYLRDLGRHRFCAAPRGNGDDTHRFWESQYLGVVPIVERSVHTEHWAASGLRVVLIDDWNEVTPERLTTEAERLGTTAPAAAPDALRLSHYARLLADATA